MYNFLQSNNQICKNKNGNKPVALIPSNICECVPATYLKCSMDVALVDIEKCSWKADENEILKELASNKNITVLHYNRTYGDSTNHEEFLNKVRVLYPELIIVDDRCLSYPVFDYEGSASDLILFSTGNTKPVNIGYGAFAFIKDGFKYKLHSLDGDYKAKDEDFDRCIKYCHALHCAVDMNVMLANWMDPAIEEGNGYFEKVEAEYESIKLHKAELNEIYSKLPSVLPKSMQEWRYHILVNNQEECLKALFDAGLFASKHYMSLGNGYFKDTKTPNCDWLESHVINLFNDRKFAKEMAEKAVEVLLKVADFVSIDKTKKV